MNKEKKSGLTGNRSLTFAMTERNALSIEVTYDSFEEVTKKNKTKQKMIHSYITSFISDSVESGQRKG